MSLVASVPSNYTSYIATFISTHASELPELNYIF